MTDTPQQSVYNFHGLLVTIARTAQGHTIVGYEVHDEWELADWVVNKCEETVLEEAELYGG